MSLIFLLLFFIISGFVLFYFPKLGYWSLSIFLYYLFLFYFKYNQEINSFLFLFVLFSSLSITIIFLLKPFRLIIISQLYNLAKKVLPKISETEQLALNAGEPWFEKYIFQGKPDFDQLHKIKKFTLNEEEEFFLNNETNELCSLLDDWQITHVDRDLPVNVWKFLRDKGFFGLVIPKEYGGKGFSASAHSQIVIKIATRSASAAVTVMVPNSLGPGELLYHYGTTEQKNYYLPRLAKGIEIPCFALTSDTAGSDATSIKDEGIVSMGEYNGNQVLGIKLKNVSKRYITLAPVATLIGLAFKLKDPDNLLNNTGKEGITCVLLPHTLKGIEIGNRLLPLDQAFMNGTIRINESFIPIDWIIGGQEMAGEGWRMLVECLSIGRAISLPACSVANSMLSTVTTSAYSVIREQFKQPIGHFEGIEEVLAKMGAITYMTNATRQFTVLAIENNVRPSVASAISKYHITELGRIVLNDAMDVHAGKAIIMGPTNYLGRSYQGIPVGITVEGANILTRNLIIFGQGAMRCHPYIRAEHEALLLKNGLNDFDKNVCGHIGYFLQNFVRSFCYSITGAIFAKSYSSPFKSYYKQITRLSSNFAFISDLVLMILGGGLKKKERISSRLGDVLSHLYMALSTLKYYEDNGKRLNDEIYVKWALEFCLYNSSRRLISVLNNFPNKYLGKALKFLVFPFGNNFKLPNDLLEHEISKDLLNDSITRKDFKNNVYLPDDINDIIGGVEKTYSMILELKEVRKRIINAIHNKLLTHYDINIAQEKKIISEEELNKLIKAQEMIAKIIKVDEFKDLELGPKNALVGLNN